jgi:hypothetical protein
LRAALESILAQTFRDFEFLIVDDGSRDESAAIVEQCGDSRIRLVRNAENKGQTACLNQGLALARGQWIARQDADDISRPRRIERQLARVAQEPAPKLLGSQAWLIDGTGKVAGLLNVPLGPASFEWASLFENPVVHTAAFFCRETALRLGGYDPAFRICQDYDLWARFSREHPAANLPGRHVLYRVTPGSLQHADRATVHGEARRIFDRLWARAFPYRPPTSEELTMIDQFRKGVPVDRVDAFRACYDALLDEYRRAHPSLDGERDLRRTVALHRAAIARSLAGSDPGASIAQFARAFATDPGLLLGLAAAKVVPNFSSPSEAAR